MPPRPRLTVPFLVIFLAAVIATAAATSSHAATFTVTSTAATGPAQDCAAGGDGCTLGGAILAANADPDPDAIRFALPSGSATIAPTKDPLPAITAPVDIDGRPDPLTATPGVELDGSALPAPAPDPDPNGFKVRGANGLLVQGARDVAIRGLAIHSFPGASIQVLDSPGGVVIRANHLGTDLEGFEDRGRVLPDPFDTVGVDVEGSDGTFVGGFGAEDRNVIGGLERGVVVSRGAQHTRVVGNWVGLSADGNVPLPNDHTGILLTKQPFGAASRNSLVANNFVAATGSAVDQSDGEGVGIALISTIDDELLQNYVGFNPFGQVVGAFGQGFGNVHDGIGAIGVTGTQIGRATEEVSIGNHVAASGDNGIIVNGATQDVSVRSNVIGLDADGLDTDDEGHATGNGANGLVVVATGDGAGATGTDIGGVDPLDANVIAGNGSAGVLIWGDVREPWIGGNRIGTDKTGTRALGNEKVGVRLHPLDGASPTRAVIGTPSAPNVIAGEVEGVTVAAGSDTFVQGNRIGLGADGRALGVGVGVAVRGGADALVGGAAEGEGNVIADAADAGVVVQGDPKRTDVHGNRLGAADDGETREALGSSTAIAVREADDGKAALGVDVGGPESGQGNLVAYADTGVAVVGDVRGVRVRGNQLGGDDAPNGTAIRVIGADGTQVGGSRPGDGNVIRAAYGFGVDIVGRGATRFVEGNRIGTANAGPKQAGVRLMSASGVTVGTPSDKPIPAECVEGCNDIRNTGGPGVVLRGDGHATTVFGNRYADLGGLPIDLGDDGPSPLDAHDADSGPNDGLNKPALVQLVRRPRDAAHPWAVTGAVESDDPTALTIHVFGQDAIDDQAGARFGEETTHLGTATPDRHGRFVLPITDAQRHPYVTALAVADDGSTSEFALGCGAQDIDHAQDADGDGLCDAWELHGIDFDGAAPTPDLDLPGLGARVGIRDLLLEVDATPGAAPDAGALRRVRAAFADAPGSPIALHVVPQDRGGAIGAAPAPDAVIDGGQHGDKPHDDLGDYLYGEAGKPCTAAFGTSADHDDANHCFARLGARRAAVRYALFTDRIVAGPHGSFGLTPGGQASVIAIAGQKPEDVAKDATGDPSCGNPRACRTVVEAFTLMHELGHALGLRHHGESDTPVSDPALLSVMSHPYSMPWASGVMDFSRGDGPQVDEQHVDERAGIPVPAGPAARGWKRLLGAAVERHQGRRYCVAVTISRPRDLDDDAHEPRQIDVIAHGINDFATPGAGDLPCRETHNQTDHLGSAFDEWASLAFSPAVVEDDFAEVGAAARGAGLAASADPTADLDAIRANADLDGDGVLQDEDVCPLREDPEQEDADHDGIGDACLGDLLEADVALALDGPDRAAPGAEQELVLHATNDWPRAVGGVEVHVAGADGLQVVGAAGDGAFDAATGTWSAGTLPARGAAELRVRVKGDAAGEGRLVADVRRAGPDGARDADSVAGNDDRAEDDHAERSLTVIEPEHTPVVAVADARVTEGDRTSRPLRFRVTLDRDAAVPVTLRARTAGATATSGEDFDAVDAEVTIPAGERAASVAVPVRADADAEPDERLTLTLSDLHGADAGDVEATGTIVDDDAPLAPGQLAPFGCASGRTPKHGCTLQDERIADTQGLTAVGDRDLYALGLNRVVHLRRDPATETWEVGDCVGLGSRSGACDTPTDAKGDPVIDYSSEDLVAASADGRWIVVATTWPGTGTDGGVLVLRRDPADGSLTLASCTGGVQAEACDGEGGSWYPDALAVAPDGRDVYLLDGNQVQHLRITDEGKVDPVACVDDAPVECYDVDLPDHADARAAFAPDGRTLLVRSAGRLTRVARDPATGALSKRDALALPGTGGIAVAPDGRTAFAGTRERGTVTTVGLEDAALVPGPCAQDADATPDAGCAVHGTGLAAVVGLVATAEAVYGALDDGGMVTIRRGGPDGLVDVRCADPETGDVPCGERSTRTPPDHPYVGRRTPVLSPDGRLAFAAGGGILERYVIVQRGDGGNRAPLCGPVKASAQTNRPARIALSCADFDGDRLTYRLVGAPAHGTVDAFSATTGELTYRPARGFRGEDVFAYEVSDAHGATAGGPIAIAVGDQPPRCGAGDTRVVAGTTVGIDVRCEDPEGGAVTLEVVGPPQHGTLTLADKRLTYAAAPDWTGDAVVVMRATDEDGSTSEARVNLVVVSPPPPPPGPGGPPGGQDGGDDAPRPGGGDAPRCRRSCVPDDRGTVEITYYCGGRRTTAGGYANCQLEAWLVVCQNGSCQRSRTRAVISAARRAPAGTLAAHAKATVRAGASGSVKLALNRAARKLLDQSGSLRVELVMDVRDADGHRSQTRQAMTLRAPATLTAPKRLAPAQAARAGIPVTVACRTACTVRVDARAAGRAAGRTVTVRLKAGARRTVRVPAPAGRGRRALTVRARFGDGRRTTTTLTRKVQLR